MLGSLADFLQMQICRYNLTPASRIPETYLNNQEFKAKHRTAYAYRESCRRPSVTMLKHTRE